MRKTILAVAAAVAVATSAVAQAPTPAAAPSFVAVPDSGVLASNLIGLNVTNAGDQNVGEIKDVVLVPGKGLQGLIMSVGGFLGMGEHYVVVDPASVVLAYDGAAKKWRARMNATADQLKAAPAFKYEGKWKS